MNYTSIKNWAEEDRPREKMLEKGCSSLTETELLAILLGSGTRNASAIDLAKQIFARANNNLNELYKCSISDLMQVKGIGKAKAISLSAAFELGRRRNLAESSQKKQITSSSEIYNLMHPKIGDIKYEEFWAILLNNKNAVIGIKRISSGGITSTVVDTKLIAHHVIELFATGLILCHNHPSGNCNPSQEDKRITMKVIEAMKLLDCKLVDHVIVSENGYYSFIDEGLL